MLLESAKGGLSRLKHLWLDAGYEDRGRRWAPSVHTAACPFILGLPEPP